MCWRVTSMSGKKQVENRLDGIMWKDVDLDLISSGRLHKVMEIYNKNTSNLIKARFIELFDKYPKNEITYKKIWDCIDEICEEIESGTT
jgi:Tfp pilus assembly ATPase PilU